MRVASATACPECCISSLAPIQRQISQIGSTADSDVAASGSKHKSPWQNCSSPLLWPVLQWPGHVTKTQIAQATGVKAALSSRLAVASHRGLTVKEQRGAGQATITTFALPGVASAASVATGCPMAAPALKTGTARRTGAKVSAAAADSARPAREMAPGLFATAPLLLRAAAITINAKPVQASADFAGALCPMVRPARKMPTAQAAGARASHQLVAKARAGQRRMMESESSVMTPRKSLPGAAITISAKPEKANVEFAVARFPVELPVPRRAIA